VFGSDSVVLVAGINTVYTCSYTETFMSILNVSESKSFAMEGGVLQFGTSRSPSINYYFSWVSGIGASMRISYMEIQFMSEMNSLVNVEGGSLILEHVMLENEVVGWVHPLIHVKHSVSFVTVELISCSVSDCEYKYGGTEWNKSSVVYFFNDSTADQAFFLNISSCVFCNDILNMSGLDYGGGICRINSFNYDCCLLSSFFI
jgi:hypothetical protein